MYLLNTELVALYTYVGEKLDQVQVWLKFVCIKRLDEWADFDELQVTVSTLSEGTAPAEALLV